MLWEKRNTTRNTAPYCTNQNYDMYMCHKNTQLREHRPKHIRTQSDEFKFKFIPDFFLVLPLYDLFLPPISGVFFPPLADVCRCLVVAVHLCVAFVPLLSALGTSGQPMPVASVLPTSSAFPHFVDHGVLGFSPHAPSVTGVNPLSLETIILNSNTPFLG